MRKLLFKRLFAFFLFRIRRHGVQNATVLCRPVDIYHWWKWLSRKAAAAETVTVMPEYWGHTYVPGKEAWTETVWHQSSSVSVTCFSFPLLLRLHPQLTPGLFTETATEVMRQTPLISATTLQSLCPKSQQTLSRPQWLSKETQGPAIHDKNVWCLLVQQTPEDWHILLW